MTDIESKEQYFLREASGSPSSGTIAYEVNPHITDPTIITNLCGLGTLISWPIAFVCFRNFLEGYEGEDALFSLFFLTAIGGLLLFIAFGFAASKLAEYLIQIRKKRIIRNLYNDFKDAPVTVLSYYKYLHWQVSDWIGNHLLDINQSITALKNLQGDEISLDSLIAKKAILDEHQNTLKKMSSEEDLYRYRFEQNRNNLKKQVEHLERAKLPEAVIIKDKLRSLEDSMVEYYKNSTETIEAIKTHMENNQ